MTWHATAARPNAMGDEEAVKVLAEEGVRFLRGT
jgi:hypothetical protein